MFLLVFIAASLNAQIIASDSVVKVTQGGADTTSSVLVKVHVTNLTADTQKVYWKRLINSNDPSWTGGTAICDLNTCYQATTSSCPLNAPSILGPDTTVIFSVTFYNNNDPGNGHVQL